MIFDSQGLVKDNKSDDWADSARLAGLMALLEHPKAPDCELYFVNGLPVRHPTESTYPENEPRCMSRDQLVCLAAGLWAEGSIAGARHIDNILGAFAPNDLDEKKKTWKMPDILEPSVKNHFALCAKREGFWLGYKWLEMSIKFNAKFTPLREPNQLIAVCAVAGPEYMKAYKNSCDWKKAIRLYWAESYRQEPEWAEFMIERIEKL